MKWKLFPLDEEQVIQFGTRYQIPTLAAQAFLRRGITRAEDLRFFIDGNIKSTHNPFLFQEMENVVERINQAAQETEAVMVCGDRDVDGITSAALMIRKLKSLGLDPIWNLPMNDSPYGLSKTAVNLAHEKGVTLIITVDCGITNLDEIDLAVELGIDVLVIDHHNPQDELPAAVGTINPKVPGSEYPFAGLCAAALVAKVNWALDFSKTPLYQDEQCLINIRPSGESLVFEAVKLRNLIEYARLSETIAVSNPAVIQNRIIPFIQGIPLFVYDEATQRDLMQKIFGQGTEIYVHDIGPETHKTFPDFKGRSLLRMIPGSRLSRFGTTAPGEIDVLKHLAIALFQARVAETYRRHDEEMRIVALSIIADMMPVLDENRIMVKRGLEGLQSIAEGGLHSLLSELGLIQSPISLRDIGWKLTPVINSAGRLGRPDVALSLLLSDDVADSRRIVKDLMQMNQERKRQGDLAWVRIQTVARENLATNGGKLILVRDDEIPRGITGILAGKLSREFRVPSAVLARVEENLVGSIRTARGVNVTDFLSGFSDLLLDWGGHDAAGGFYLELARFPEFSERVTKSLATLELEESVEPSYDIDIEVPSARMTEELWNVENIFQPFGQDSAQILYAARSLRITALSPMGKEQKHLRLTLDSGQRQWPAVFWDAADRVRRDFWTGDTVDVLFRLEKNNYGQSTTLQLNICDLQRVEAKP